MRHLPRHLHQRTASTIVLGDPPRPGVHDPSVLLPMRSLWHGQANTTTASNPFWGHGQREYMTRGCISPMRHPAQRKPYNEMLQHRFGGQPRPCRIMSEVVLRRASPAQRQGKTNEPSNHRFWDDTTPCGVHDAESILRRCVTLLSLKVKLLQSGCISPA